MIFTSPSVTVQGSADFVQKEIPVVIKPLKVGSETVPVQIQCDPVFIFKSDTIESFNCVLVNLTDKNIRSSSVRYSLISDNAGREQRSDRLDITDTYIHPDFADIRKPIAPGGILHIMAPGPLVEPGSVIKTLELEPIYLEFSDGTTIGIGGESALKIAEVRKGATAFKQLLQKEFQSKGKSAQALLPLIEDSGSVESSGFSNGGRIGANAYRRFLLEKYQKSGSSAIDKLLGS
jgi:hypothetical protein